MLFCFTQIFIPLFLGLNKNVQKVYKQPIIQEQKTEEKVILAKDEWKIEIPKINLSAEIKDGVESETLNQFVGHFEESGYLNGNVALAAHNRGYPVNYFKNVKELEPGDEIIYYFEDKIQKYTVNENKIIKDTDVKVVENTEENQITLITCVEDQPEKRRCVIGNLI